MHAEASPVSRDQLADVAIIGAGAAGLFAAIFAGRQAQKSGRSLRILALDGAARLGAKILVAGGGRCNVTHFQVKSDDFAGTSLNTIARVLRTFDVPQTIAFFEELGVTLKREDTGKLFPVTDKAQTVLDALLTAAKQAGVELKTSCRVTGVERDAASNHFIVHTSTGDIPARSIVLATGGKSLPKTGSDGVGYSFAQALGHTVTPTTPALVPLLLPEGHWLTSLSGIAVDVELSLHEASGKLLRRHRGAMLMTHFGLSGPVVLDISRHWIAAHERDPNVTLRSNFFPGLDFAKLDQQFVEAGLKHPRVSVIAYLRPYFPERLVNGLCAAAQIPGPRGLGHLTKEFRRSLVHTLTALPLPVVRDRGYLFAEVTAGGVPLTEIDPSTMQSRRCPKLHFCGEILDVDGRIGGFNFQWAWASGQLAGTSVVKSLVES